MEHVIGYLRFRCGDFRRRKARAQTAELQQHFKERISYWRRAIHLCQRLGARQHQRLARRLLRDITVDLEYRKIPYVAETEVAPDRDDRSKLDEKPKRGPGKPRVVPLEPADFIACTTCNGDGFFRKRGT